LQKSTPGSALGPVKVGSSLQVLYYLDVRDGSEEGFQKAKPQLSAIVQAQDFDRRLGFWLEGKKKDLQIIINK